MASECILSTLITLIRLSYSNIMEFTQTSKGKNMLIDGGYMYVFQKDLANDVQSWECTERRKNTCRARVKLLNDQIVDRVNAHTHAPSGTQAEVQKVRVAIKRRAETTLDAPHRIISDGFAQASEAVAVNLPCLNNVRRAVRRYRADNAALPANPADRAGIPAIPHNYSVTNRGDRFLLHDSGVGDAERILLFGTDDALALMRQSDHWFGDGTFSVSPLVFFQLYTIHSICEGKVIPCLYALLPNKTGATYDRLLTEVGNNMNGHAPTDILFDFEQAAFNAAQGEFPGVDVKGCFFHLCQNVWKKIQQNGLAQLYQDDDDFSILMRSITALAFVPEADVPQSFVSLEMEIRNNYNNNGIDVVLDYFEDNYIGRRRGRNRRAIPPFPISIWNMVERTEDDLPRTNNNIEGWHHRFSLNVDGAHPTLWKFIESLKREESLVRAELAQVLGGHPVTQKRKYADCAMRIKNIVTAYPVRRADIIRYLRSIAHNLSF